MRPTSPTTAFIALGANRGNREKNIHAALDALASTPNISIIRVSTLIETAPIGGPPNSPSYLNAAAELQTTLGSHALLHRTLEIEKSLGRVRRDKWEPRPIDIDLLLFGDQIISSQELVIPHPLMHERRFVLEPLAQIAPQAVHPTLQMTIAGLLQNLDRQPPAP